MNKKQLFVINEDDIIGAMANEIVEKIVQKHIYPLIIPASVHELMVEEITKKLKDWVMCK